MPSEILQPCGWVSAQPKRMSTWYTALCRGDQLPRILRQRGSKPLPEKLSSLMLTGLLIGLASRQISQADGPALKPSVTILLRIHGFGMPTLEQLLKAPPLHSGLKAM